MLVFVPESLNRCAAWSLSVGSNSKIWANEEQDQKFVKFILPFLMCFSWHCPLHFAALFITRTLLFNTNSGFFSRFSSFERLPSITVVFPRTFHHLYASLRCFTALFVMWTLLFNNSGVFPLFSSSERFSSTSAAVCFILCTHFPQFKFFSHLLSFTPVASFLIP